MDLTVSAMNYIRHYVVQNNYIRLTSVSSTEYLSNIKCINKIKKKNKIIIFWNIWISKPIFSNKPNNIFQRLDLGIIKFDQINTWSKIVQIYIACYVCCYAAIHLHSLQCFQITERFVVTLDRELSVAWQLLFNSLKDITQKGLCYHFCVFFSFYIYWLDCHQQP